VSVPGSTKQFEIDVNVNVNLIANYGP